jgi:hypothetical protein
MPVHQSILSAVTAICAERGSWEFSPAEVVRALPHLRPGTIRTHVTSRLCVNAPANHDHRWPYFRRLARGTYEVLQPYRSAAAAAPPPDPRPRKHVVAGEVPRSVRDTVHAVVSRDIGWYVGECLEIPVVAQGRTIDEVVAGLRLALERRLAMDDPSKFGLTRSPRVMISFEFNLSRAARR